MYLIDARTPAQFKVCVVWRQGEALRRLTVSRPGVVHVCPGWNTAGYNTLAFLTPCPLASLTPHPSSRCQQGGHITGATAPPTPTLPSYCPPGALASSLPPSSVRAVALPEPSLTFPSYCESTLRSCQQGGHIAGAINIPEGDCHLPTVNITLSTIPKNKVCSRSIVHTHRHLQPQFHQSKQPGQ